MARKDGYHYYRDRIALEAVLAAKRLAHRVRAPAGPPAPAEVAFVAGVQRSGTNMLMDVLEQSFATDVYHERDPRAFDNYMMRDLATVEELHRRCRAAHFVIKSLCELQRLPELLGHFPGSKAVWIVRHHDDVVNSMRLSFRDQGDQIRALAKDRDASSWRGQGMSDATQALLRRFASPQMNDDTGAALLWYVRNVLFFEQGFDRDPRVLAVAYENLVTRPREEFERIFRFLGLGYRPWYSRKVVPSSIRKRQPPEVDRPVRALCQDLLERFEPLVEGPPDGTRDKEGGDGR
jgi:hypothetical protein